MFESDTNEEILDYIKSSEIFESSKNIEELIDNNIQYLKWKSFINLLHSGSY